MSKIIALLGAHTAAAKAIHEELETRALDVSVVRATTSDHVDAESVLIDAALVERADLFVHTFGGSVPLGLARGLSARGAVQIDLAGLLEDAPRVFPTLDAGAGAVLARERAVAFPLGLAEPVAAAIAALAVFTPRRTYVTTLESAATFDRPGMDELSEQTRAVFTLQDRAPEVFGATLAFSVIPDVSGTGDPLAADAAFGETVAEALAAAGAPAVEIRTTRTLVPSFSAEAAVVDVELDDAPDEETVERALRATRGAVLKDGPGVPLVDAVGRGDALLSRLAVDDDHLRFWVVADRLGRGCAVPTALLLERWLDELNGGTE